MYWLACGSGCKCMEIGKLRQLTSITTLELTKAQVGNSYTVNKAVDRRWTGLQFVLVFFYLSLSPPLFSLYFITSLILLLHNYVLLNSYSFSFHLLFVLIDIHFSLSFCLSFFIDSNHLFLLLLHTRWKSFGLFCFSLGFHVFSFIN